MPILFKWRTYEWRCQKSPSQCILHSCCYHRHHLKCSVQFNIFAIVVIVVIVAFFALLDDDDDNDDEVERFWVCCFIWIYFPFLILEDAFQVNGIQQRLLQRILYNDTRTKLMERSKVNEACTSNKALEKKRELILAH